ncbi:MAG: ribonuclease E/G [Alphaproteobacteria bacterium]|nr:ribonuclease E/G [Alphaproteobacteria bacterium]
MIADTLIYEKNDQEVRLAALDGGTMVEFDLYNENHAIEGNIYLGKIKKRIELANGNSGFLIDIGDDELAFLNAFENGLKEINMNEGQSVVVQVSQEKRAEKGAKVVRNIQIVGTTLVYRPFKVGVDVSSKIENAELAKEYKTAVWENVTGQEGWALRTAAVEFSIDEVLEEMVKLRNIYENIRVKARNANAPSLLYIRENPLYEFIRRYKDTLKTVVVNNHHLFDELENILGDDMAQYAVKPFEEYGLNEQIFDALNRTVSLKSGGNIHIEQTRACVTIDVDTSNLKSGSNITKANDEAAFEIARQIRLKNLSGKIIIDFAGSSEYRFMKSVIDILQTQLADDPSRARVLGLSKAGNIEILRQRRRPSILDIFTQECSACQGTGRVEK